MIHDVLISYNLNMCCQVKASAREEHLKEVQAKSKPKRKRGPKQAVSAASKAPSNPPSPQRDAKKAKGNGTDGTAGSAGAGGGDPVPPVEQETESGNPVQPVEETKSKSKRKTLEEVKEAWAVKEHQN